MWSNELKICFAFEQFTLLLNINPLKKMFEEIFFFIYEISNENQMLRRAQLYTTTEVEP